MKPPTTTAPQSTGRPRPIDSWPLTSTLDMFFTAVLFITRKNKKAEPLLRSAQPWINSKIMMMRPLLPAWLSSRSVPPSSAASSLSIVAAPATWHCLFCYTCKNLAWLADLLFCRFCCYSAVDYNPVEIISFLFATPFWLIVTALSSVDNFFDHVGRRRTG